MHFFSRISILEAWLTPWLYGASETREEEEGEEERGVKRRGQSR